MKILFHDNYLCERGTTVALFDYALYNQKILNNESIITFNLLNSGNNEGIIKKFINHFEVIAYDGTQNKQLQLNKICEQKKIDLYYGIKSGEDDKIYPTNTKVGAHCVFNMKEPHGNVYAAICNYMSNKHGGIFPVVHHIIEDKANNVHDNLRTELNIPINNFVFGRYGGYDTFSLNFVKNTVKEVINLRDDVWFIFLNTEKFIDHPRVLFLPLQIDINYKAKFVNTCDAMLHARKDGEVFSLAVSEFSVKNKPIITWNPDAPPPCYDTGHIYILKDKGIYYKNNEDLKHLLLNIKKEDVADKDWNAYKDTYSPTAVMDEFKNVFID
jgi:hypothetical protein